MLWCPNHPTWRATKLPLTSTRSRQSICRLPPSIITSRCQQVQLVSHKIRSWCRSVSIFSRCRRWANSAFQTMYISSISWTLRVFWIKITGFKPSSNSFRKWVGYLGSTSSKRSRWSVATPVKAHPCHLALTPPAIQGHPIAARWKYFWRKLSKHLTCWGLSKIEGSFWLKMGFCLHVTKSVVKSFKRK